MSAERRQDSLSAIALRYDGENAPVVTAKGTGEIARQIIDIAREHNVPLLENAHLVRMLVLLDLGDEIPEALYVAIAEIIAFAYWLNEVAPEAARRTQSE
ncbi:MAG: EscU/YscU/HrcU family type III secretion system export apparatus switch protein [Pseudomonadota bacterium]